MSKVMCHKCGRIHGGNFSLCDWCMNAKIIDIEAQLKTKDEEIEKIKQQKRCLSLDKTIMIDRWLREKHKARSIVAMLFWEWRKAERIIEEDEFLRESNTMKARVDEKKIAFEMAYALLKDKK